MRGVPDPRAATSVWGGGGHDAVLPASHAASGGAAALLHRPEPPPAAADALPDQEETKLTGQPRQAEKVNTSEARSPGT